MDPNLNTDHMPWEYSLDIDDSDLNLTPTVRSSQFNTSNQPRIIPGPAGTVHFEGSSSTSNPVRIIPGPAGVWQQAKLRKDNMWIDNPDVALLSTQEYMQQVVEDVGEDTDFYSRAWIKATDYVLSTGSTVTGCLGDIDNFLVKGKLEQVVAIVKTCKPNDIGDLSVTLKDLSGTVRGTVHYKVFTENETNKPIMDAKDIHVGAAMILQKVSVFTPKPGQHYLNITKRNVVKVFRKDTV